MGTTDRLADPAENGDSVIPLDGTPGAEVQEGDTSQWGFPTGEPLTVQTDVAAAAGADTTEPTTAADSPEVERDGEGGQGGEEDEWAIPMKAKKNKGKNTSAAATQAAQGGGVSGGGDEGFTGAGGKKKKGKGKR